MLFRSELAKASKDALREVVDPEIGLNIIELGLIRDVIIEDDVMIGAGSLVPPRKVLKSGYLYVGSPVQQVRPLTEKELAFLPYSAKHYVKVQNNHKDNQTN